MAAKLTIFILRHLDFGQIWKTTFPKEFFNEIWLKIWIALQYWNNI